MSTRRHFAFTSIELLAVIATIIVLASLVLPSFGKAKRSTLMQQTRMQFCKYSTALDEYFNEYGYFPRIISPSSDLPSESVITLTPEMSKNLILALSGRDIDGVSDLSDSDSYLNPSGITFLEFSDYFFYKYNGKVDRTRLADGFNNTDIHIVVENTEDSDVLIPQSVFSEYPTIQSQVPSDGIRLKIAIFTVGDNKNSLDVVSWKRD